MRKLALRIGVAVVALAAASAAQGEVKDVAHPFLLWTREEAAAIKQRIETDPVSKKQYEQMLTKAWTTGGKSPPRMINLFKYSVLGDKAAGAAEKKALLDFVGKRPPSNKPGDPNSGNAQWRDDRTMDALRFDVLYDELSESERAGLIETIKGYVEWQEKANGPWRNAPRTGWLPNMQWPTTIAVHNLAVATRDEALIRRVFESGGGWKWYFDNYVAGDRFYMEEFAKYYSNIGAMLLWCEGLERLGLSKYGYGYTGKNGATMQKFLYMLPSCGYPRIQRGEGGTFDYDAVTMGDASKAYVLQGYTAAGEGGTPVWGGGMMNGPIPKLMYPLWWEIGHRRFPKDGYDYFLAQLRKPGEDVYLPSLYFGLSAIDAKKVKAPPAPSLVTRERGFALLRADESPAYWESPKPAVAMQFGMYYVHYVHDAFATLQYVAHNRYIYNKMGSVGSGYAGGDPWRDHVRGQAGGVIVDGDKPQPVDRGDNGCENQRIRHQFAGPMKFVAARANGLFKGVAQERAMVLTDDYLFEANFLSSSTPRVYDWHVLAPATLAEDKAWKPVDELGGKIREQDVKKPHIANVVARDAGDKPWLVTLSQAVGEKPAGVHVRMLGGADTAVVAGTPPGLDGGGFKGAGASARGVQLIATRTAPAVAFVALHEPFTGPARIEKFEPISQTDTGVAVAVTGKDGLDDRVLLQVGEKIDTPVTLAGRGESYTITGHAFVRIGADRVEAFGDIKAMSVAVKGSPKLVLEGKETPATVKGGVLTFER